MGRFANEVLVGWYNRLLTKLLDMKDITAVPQLAPELMATLELGQMPPDWRFLGGENLWICSFDPAGTPGNAQGFNMRLPDPAGTIAVIETIVLSSAAVATINAQLLAGGAVDLASTRTPTTRDARNVTGGTPIICSQGDATHLSAGTLLQVAANTPTVLPQSGFVLAPRPAPSSAARNISLRITSGTVATSLVGFVAWRERPIGEAERGSL